MLKIELHNRDTNGDSAPKLREPTPKSSSRDNCDINSRNGTSHH